MYICVSYVVYVYYSLYEDKIIKFSLLNMLMILIFSPHEDKH